ncbi:MAG: Crp/Fnr family transcriptional regulator [Thermodesulfovibrionales bacterium]
MARDRAYDIQGLKSLPIFSSLADEELREVQEHVVLETFRKKENIFLEGTTPEWIYLLVSGKVKITKISHDGKEITLELISPPHLFGSFPVLKGIPYLSNAVAMGTSEVLKISQESFLKIIDWFPATLYEFTGSLGYRIHELHETLTNIALAKVETRIAALLVKLAFKAGEMLAGGGAAITISLTKQDIAEMVGTTAATAIRVMSKFKKLGLITEESGRIIISDLEALRTLSR